MPEVIPTPTPDAGGSNTGPDINAAPPPGGTGKVETPPPKVEAKPNPTPDGGGGSKDIPPKVDDPNWDAKTTSYIKSLRTENASYRTKAKESGTQLENLQGQMSKVQEALGITKPDPTVEDFENATNQNEQVNFRNGILEAALANGIPSTGLDYFSYLVESKVQALGEGQELSDDDVALLANQTKEQFPSGTTNTSIGGTKLDKDGKPIVIPKPPAGGSETTVQQFSKMTTTEKSELYTSNPTLYDKLMGEAKDQQIFI